MTPTIKFRKLHESAIIPEYKTAGAAGMDLVWFDHDDFPWWEIQPGEIRRFHTSLAIEIPDGFEAQIRSRSGLASSGVVVANSPGTFDSDYRGEIIVLLGNIWMGPHLLQQTERIAQLVIAPVARCQIQVVDELSPTERGAGGFGSTGR